jgi:hypothetical protein
MSAPQVGLFARVSSGLDAALQTLSDMQSLAVLPFQALAA